LNEAEARAFIGRSTRAVLATIKRDGRPQLSNVSYTLDDDGLIKISVTRDRAKTRNLLRDPRASLTILGDAFSDYVVVEGTCEVHDGDVVPELRHVYERITGGPHPNWEEFDAAMIADGRVVLAISIDRIYPLSA
jgi:PPOX class probable F420-dependent enzyme